MLEDRDEVFSQFVVDKMYCKEEGTACFAPYLDIRISSLTGRSSNSCTIRARIDTGADISVVPEDAIESLMPTLKGRSVLVRGHDGSVKRNRTHLLCIGLIGYPDEDQVYWARPERGVLATDSSIALIGADILHSFDMHMKGLEQTFSLIRR